MGQVRSGRIAQLKAVGGLGTCGCCFDDELLPEDQLIPIGGANIYSCPMVEAMPIAHSYPEAWSRRNSDVAQPRAMAFVSHVSPGGNYVTMSDCDTRGSNFFRTFSSTKIYGFLRGKG